MRQKLTIYRKRARPGLRSIDAHPLTDRRMSASTAAIPPARQDAAVIGLVGMAHLISHYSQLLLAPLLRR